MKIIALLKIGLMSFVLTLSCTISFGQELFLQYGTEVDLYFANFNAQIHSEFEGDEFNYNLNLSQLKSRLSLSTIKFGYIWTNGIYAGAYGSLILDLYDGNILKDNLWSRRDDISHLVYGNGSETYTARAVYSYSRFFGLELGKELNVNWGNNYQVRLFTSINLHYQNRYFGEQIEKFRYQYYQSGSQEDFAYRRTKEYRKTPRIAPSLKALVHTRNLYFEVQIGAVNSIGFGFMRLYER